MECDAGDSWCIDDERSERHIDGQRSDRHIDDQRSERHIDDQRSAWQTRQENEQSTIVGMYYC